MQGYVAPVKDMQFLLHRVLEVTASAVPGYAELEESLTEAVLTEAGRLAAGVLAPLNASGDREGCRLENGTVRTPEGFRAAYQAFCDGGWTGLDCDADRGGQDLPYLMNTAAGEIFSAANMALNLCPGLSHGAYSAIRVHGSEAQKAAFLPNLVSGRWTGTMNLTEPHCGTDLGLMRTKAEPQADGSYLITGQKIFISWGDHDLTDNIVHLVLAKAPGGGEGTKGISLFIAPKVLVNDDGSLGQRNRISVGKVERKMGIHASPTCVMNYDGATGWLLGDLHRGLAAMFTMMNEARIGVGVQGLAVAGAAYQASLAYARDRLQGRAATGAKHPGQPADPLIVHPDIRRMLMDQKAFTEGGRALAFWGATLVDAGQRGGDKGGQGMASLMTPVIKGYLTDKGFDSTVLAQQVFGGYGYIEDTGVSQLVRDARIAMIYEGANGIQAIDLVARKLGSDGGAHTMAFFRQVGAVLQQIAGDDRLKADFHDPLAAALADLQAATGRFAAKGMTDPEDVLAGSADFLHLFGLTSLGFMWARMALAAQAALDQGTGDPAFLNAKLATGRYFMARHLPATRLHLARIDAGAETVMALSDDAF